MINDDDVRLYVQWMVQLLEIFCSYWLFKVLLRKLELKVPLKRYFSFFRKCTIVFVTIFYDYFEAFTLKNIHEYFNTPFFAFIRDEWRYDLEI